MHKNNISSWISIFVSFSGIIILSSFLISPTLKPSGKSASSIFLFINFELLSTCAWIISAWLLSIAKTDSIFPLCICLSILDTVIFLGSTTLLIPNTSLSLLYSELLTIIIDSHLFFLATAEIIIFVSSSFVKANNKSASFIFA